VTSMQNMKKIAAAKALEFVEQGMRLGIGTGSTAEEFIALLAQQVAQGFDIVGVPTSQRTQLLCEKLHIPLTTLDACPELDLVVDGADEIDKNLNLIKGGGGALLREKIVAQAARRMVVIVDESKQVEQFGSFPLPIEINPFGLGATRALISRVIGRLGLVGVLHLRTAKGAAFVTDGGHYILDLKLTKPIADPHALSQALHSVAGVVEHGLFLNMASNAVIAKADGAVEVI